MNEEERSYSSSDAAYDESYSYSSSKSRDVDKYAEYADLPLLPRPTQIPEFFEVKYSEEYSKLMGYFFALYQKKEYSQRALKLCDRIIDEYPTHNAAWNFRIEIHKHTPYDPKEVREFIETQIFMDTKIYSAWNAYQWLVDNHEFDSIPFIQKVLNNEPKNFHAWSFLVWYAKRWNKPKEVYDLSLSQLEKDIFNNSAWNTRWVTGNMLGITPEAEFDSVTDVIRKTPHNESARNFLFGICEKEPKLVQKLDDFGRELLAIDQDNFNAYRILLFKASVENNKEEIQRLCDELIRTDPIRVNYYTHVKNGVLKYE